MFREFYGRSYTAIWLVVVGSVTMILGAGAISTAAAPGEEQASTQEAVTRGCDRYGLNLKSAQASQRGEDMVALAAPAHCWWDALIVTGAVGVFVWLGRLARIPPIHLQFGWMTVLFLAMLAFPVAGGWVLWRRTRFS